MERKAYVKCIHDHWRDSCRLCKNCEGIVTGSLKTQIGGAHYKHLAIQPIEYCHVNRLGPCETYAIKYITRHRDKGGKEDIEKAMHCLELLLELEYERK